MMPIALYADEIDAIEAAIKTMSPNAISPKRRLAKRKSQKRKGTKKIKKPAKRQRRSPAKKRTRR